MSPPPDALPPDHAAPPAGKWTLDPLSLLALLCGFVVVLSVVGAWAGWSAVNPAKGDVAAVQSLADRENVRRLLSEMPATVFGFAPLGMVVLILMGAGLAEKVGLVGAGLSAALRAAPRWALTPVVCLIAICAHIGSDAAYFIVIPFAGLAFAAAGRSPLAGVIAAFAAVGGGYGANVLITPTDAAVYGLTEAAARLVNPAETVDLLANYFILAAFAGLVIVIVWGLTDRWVEPRLARAFPVQGLPAEPGDAEALSAAPRGALSAAVLVMLVLLAAGAWMGLSPDGPLRDAEGGLRPFYRAFVAIVFITLTAGALVYGIAVGRLRRDSDVYRLLESAIADCAPFILLIFFAAHFAAFLDWSRLAEVAAAKGATVLGAMDLPRPALIIAFSVLTGLLNLVLPSTTAKWALMAPTAVPLMMSLGVSPELTAAAYRMGASATELVTPTAMTPIVYMFARRYAPELSFGRFLALMLPYTLAIFVAGLALLGAWSVLHLPLGPTGAPLFLS